jgi:hypothetical protein
MAPTDVSVRALTRPPFGRLAGSIGFDTGAQEFLELSSHRAVLRTILNRSRRPASMWLFAGDLGSGKTWFLSWLWREGAARLQRGTREHWEVTGFYFLPSGPIDRGFFEAFFASSGRRRFFAATHATQAGLQPAGEGVFRRAARHLLYDHSAWQVATGAAREFTKRRGKAALPSWSSPSNRLQIFLNFLRLLRESGVTNLVVLVDEFEATVTSVGKAKLPILSQFFRQLSDELQSTEGLPKVEIILCATGDVVELISPAPGSKPVTRTRTPSVLVRALRERLEPTVLLGGFTRSDALKLADHRIGLTRNSSTKARYIPYDEEAIALAYASCLGNVRTFCNSLEAMYEEALASGVERIDPAFASKVLNERGLSGEVSRP